MGLGVGVGRSVGAGVGDGDGDGDGVSGAAARVTGIIVCAGPGVLLGRGGGVGLVDSAVDAAEAEGMAVAVSRIGCTRVVEANPCAADVSIGCGVAVHVAGDIVDRGGVAVRRGVGRRLGVTCASGVYAEVSDGSNGAARDAAVELARAVDAAVGEDAVVTVGFGEAVTDTSASRATDGSMSVELGTAKLLTTTRIASRI